MTFLDGLLGLGRAAGDLSTTQICVRAVVVFLATLAVVRAADRRFMARLSAFDVVLGFILASVLARAVNGTAPFGGTLAGGFVLVLLHRLVAWAAFRWKAVGALVKGGARELVREGRADEDAMRATRISMDDLLEEARINGNVGSIADIQLATMERSGDVSIVRRKGHHAASH